MVDQTLGDLSLNGRRVVHVFNKMDRAPDGDGLRARATHRYEDTVFVSALEPPAVDELKTKFVELVESYQSGRQAAG